jgi:hypothetical protein
MPVDQAFLTEDPIETPLDIAQTGRPPASDMPIDRLRPESELHRAVLERLLAMVRFSEGHMNQFHSRWNAAELQYQAYLKTETFEQLRKASNNLQTPPELITLTVPYTFSTVQTIVTYLLHTFCGRRPIFQVGSTRADKVQAARNMETVLQYNSDHERQVRKLAQFFLDGLMYNLQIMRVMWKVEEKRRAVWKPSNVFPILGSSLPQMQKVSETAVTFEGNEVRNVDPYRFYPDPRIPMEEVAEKGEFVFWAEYESRPALKKAESAGQVKWIDAIPKSNDTRRASNKSQRGRLGGGDTGQRLGFEGFNSGYELYQGSVEIVPSEWGLGDSDEYEKWLFTIANKGQIIQAEPLDLDHNRHPVIVGEPNSTGYEFGGFALTDMIGPMQEMLSWMLNSHIFNVRSALNNTFVVNPQMVDMADLKKPGPGRVIKLKPQAFGQDIKNAFYQVPVSDVTAGHVNDMQVIQRLADNVSATNDNLRGVVNSGGRKSATEVRQTGEMGASRLAALARLISAQTMCPFAEMETVNIQQNMTQAVFLPLLGEDYARGPIEIQPGEVAGDFYYPVNDGTLPLDRVALLDVWREIFGVILKTPGLASVFDAVGIFQYIADLGGAKNLSTFKIQGAGNEQIDRALQAGNMVPASAQAAPGVGGPPQ